MKEMQVQQPVEMAQSLTLTDLDAVRTLTDPLRVRIIEALVKEACTVKQIARELGVATTKLYYHIGLLEEHGLIRVVDSRIVSGIIEKVYRAVAYSYQIDRSLLSFMGDDMHDNDLDALMATIFDTTKEEVKQSVKAGVLPLHNNGLEGTPSLISRGNVRLAPDKLHDFWQRLRELVEDYSDEKLYDPNGISYALTVAFYPTPPTTPDADAE